MSNPFKYGELVSGEYFFDREKEKDELHQVIDSGLNIFLYAPRRYGKTSLVFEVLKERRKEDICLYLDLLKAPTKRRFLEFYAKETAKTVTTKIDEVLVFCRKAFSRFVPKVTLKATGIPEIEFGVSWTKEAEAIVTEEVLDLPQKIAAEKGKRVIVVFDEFPEIANYNGREFEGELRSFIQKHKDVAYIFTGSKRRLLLKMIGDPRRPFYKSGKIMPLGKIHQQEFENFICKRFKSGNIYINSQNIKLIFNLTQNHPYYTQMFCWELWERVISKRRVEEEDIKGTLNQVLEHQREYFITIWDSLSPHQKLLLMAFAKEPSASIFSNNFIARFGLGAVSSVQKSLARLVALEVVEKSDTKYEISDIFFNIWIREKML